MRIRLAAIVLALFASTCANAGTLYKAIDSNGTVIFSDTPPAGARIIEERETSAVSSLSGEPHVANGPAAASFVDAEQMLALDPEVAQANAILDLAERQLAAARRELTPLYEGVRLRPTRLSMGDDARLEPYRKNLKIARQQLAEILRDRRMASPAPAPARIALR